MKTNYIGEIKFGDSNNILCPFCDSEYACHSDVLVFNRDEDDEKTLYTAVWHKNNDFLRMLINNESSGNPSKRRHGLLIRFRCENCNKNFFIAISQHKGTTLMEYRVKEE